jgi:hypothetical protein
LIRGFSRFFASNGQCQRSLLSKILPKLLQQLAAFVSANSFERLGLGPFTLELESTFREALRQPAEQEPVPSDATIDTGGAAMGATGKELGSRARRKWQNSVSSPKERR